jgi:ABC-2 type transport system permease protein
LTFRLSLPRLSAVLGLIQRDWAMARSYRIAFFTQLALGTISLAGYYFISKTFPAVPSSSLNGAPNYFAFVAVGAALAVVMQGAAHGLGQKIREEQLTGTLEALILQPLTSAELALGLVGFPFLFTLFNAVAYLLIANVLLGANFSHASWPAFVLALAATGAALSAIGVALGAILVVVKRAQAVVAFVVTIIMFLGGAFFPLSVLPGWLETLAKLVPTRYAFEAVRASLYQGDHWARPVASLVLFAVIAFPLAVMLFSGAVKICLRQGTLSQY